MDIQKLSKADLELLVALRQNAERITSQLQEDQKPQALDDAYAWRYDHVYTVTERH